MPSTYARFPREVILMLSKLTKQFSTIILLICTHPLHWTPIPPLSFLFCRHWFRWGGSPGCQTNPRNQADKLLCYLDENRSNCCTRHSLGRKDAVSTFTINFDMTQNFTCWFLRISYPFSNSSTKYKVATKIRFRTWVVLHKVFRKTWKRCF